MKRLTIFSVLTLAAVVGVGLLLVFINRVRQAELSVKCQYNLRWVAVGLHSHNDTYGVLPAAVVPVLPSGQRWGPLLPTGRQAGGLPVERRFSWQAQILPFMEGGRSFDGSDFTKAWDTGDNLDWVVWWKRPLKPGYAPLCRMSCTFTIAPPTPRL
jgi:hypothetical protein